MSHPDIFSIAICDYCGKEHAIATIDRNCKYRATTIDSFDRINNFPRFIGEKCSCGKIFEFDICTMKDVCTCFRGHVLKEEKGQILYLRTFEMFLIIFYQSGLVSTSFFIILGKLFGWGNFNFTIVLILFYMMIQVYQSYKRGELIKRSLVIKKIWC